MHTKVNQALEGGPCFALPSDMRIKVSPTGIYTYPDVVVVCGKPEFEDESRDVLLNPTVVIEVLSDSTEKYNRGTKFRHYQQVASVREYVLVAQDQPLVERFVRQPDGDWLLTTFSGISGHMELLTGPARVPMADVYAGVTFPEHPPR